MDDRPKHEGKLPPTERWPLRIGGVGLVLAAGLVLARTTVGAQVGWALQYSLLVAVSIVAAYWLPILIVNLGVATLWLALSFLPRRESPSIGTRIIRGLNRQIGHVEAASSWIAVAVVSTHRLWVQSAGLAAVLLLGAPIINRLARLDQFGGEGARRSHLQLLEARRSLIYFTTFLGLGLLALRAPTQSLTLAPLFIGVLPALFVRYLRFRLEKGRRRSGLQRVAPQEEQTEVALAKATSWIAAAVILAAFTLMGRGAVEQRRLSHEDAALNKGPDPFSDRCIPETGGPVDPTLAVFVVADTQLHELAGERFPGQMEVANIFVPVCRRPVELDMLSTAAVVQTAKMYQDLQATRAGRHLEPALWAHLGDLADLSCASEMKRMSALLQTFSPTPALLAGIAPGNHDSSFQGNFAWSPYWDAACDARLDKEHSDAAVGSLSTALLAPYALSQRMTGRFPDSLFQSTVAARYTISRLGIVPLPSGGRRGVLGVFVDTSDRLASNHGIAGSFGSFSKEQREEVLANVRRMQYSSGPANPWADPWFVVFAHIPYDELAGASQTEFAALVAALDAPPRPCLSGADSCSDPRVMGIVSAHTHIAESYRHCIGRRLVREIVVGSVIDPPEQAALIEIGLDSAGKGALRLSTAPTVGRPEFSCGSEPAVSVDSCRQAIKRLGTYGACQELLGAQTSRAIPACEELEAPLPLLSELGGLSRYGGPDDPRALKDLDEQSARALLRCLCRPEEPNTVPTTCEQALTAPLNGDTYAPIIDAIARAPSRREELACLAWAAADVQAHRARGMTMSDGIRCAFDDRTLPAAQVTVASATHLACPHL